MHDTFYYGGEIINTINKTLECRPTIDRGDLRIWVTSDGLKAILLDLGDNDRRGGLEVHDDGQYKASLRGGVLVKDTGQHDYYLDTNRITAFLEQYKH